MRDVIRKIAALGLLGGVFVLMTEGKRSEGERPSEEGIDGVPEYHKMSDEEFSSFIRSRNAERLGVTEQEMDEMPLSEIEEKLDIETTEPRHAHESDDSKGGYFVSDSFDVLSKEELDERRERVKGYLSKF